MLRRFAFGAALLVMLASGPVHSQQASDIRENKILLVTIAHWLSANFDLPLVLDPPRLASVAPEEMTGLLLPASATASDDVVAVYGDVERTIYLSEHWTGGTPAELSVLVHEMVHHVQNVGGLIYACRAAREKVAYAAQNQWLQLFGRDLASDLGIDPFTLLVNTNCMH